MIVFSLYFSKMSMPQKINKLRKIKKLGVFSCIENPP